MLRIAHLLLTCPIAFSLAVAPSIARPHQQSSVADVVRVTVVEQYIFVDHHARRHPHVTFSITNTGNAPVFVFGERQAPDRFYAVGESMEFDPLTKNWTYADKRPTRRPFEKWPPETRMPVALAPGESLTFTRSWMPDEIGNRYRATVYASMTRSGTPVEIRTDPFELEKTATVRGRGRGVKPF